MCEADRQGGAWCFACSVISAGAGATPATAADAGELVEARGDIVGRFGGSLELIVQVLRRFVPDMQDLLQLERQLGEGDVPGQRRDLHTIKAALPPLAPSRHGRPCQRAGAGLRRADRRGMEILAGIRLDELRTLCDACLLRLQAMFGDVQESAS